VREGYRQTEVSVIPSDWEVKHLNQLVEFTNGKAHESSIKDDGQYIVANSKFISTEGEVKKYSDNCFCPTETGNIMLVMSDVPNGKAIAKCFFVDKNNCYTVNQRICSLKAKFDDPKFLFYVINRNKYYLSFDDGVKQTNLRKDDVLGCPIPLPPTKAEQAAIADALSDADALISRLEQLIAKKRNIKQGAMQELLTGKKRLPGFSGEWEVKLVEEIAEVKSGKRLPLGNSLIAEETSHPYIRVIDMFQGGVSLNDIKYVPDDVYPAIKNYRIFKDDIFISVAGTLGIVGKIPIELDGANLTENANRLTNIRCNRGYLLYVFMSSLIQNTIDSERTLGAQPKLALTRIRKFLVPLPPTKIEQTAIAQILNDMDAEIEQLEQKLDKYRMIKQGMMQELLTGKTRLI